MSLRPFVAFAHLFRSSPAPEADDLSDGESLFAALAFAFPEAEAERANLQSGTNNFVMKRANINLLLEVAGRYAVENLGLEDASKFTDAVDVNAVAKDRDPEATLVLAEIVCAVAILTGNGAVINEVRKLPRPDQEVLQRSTKKVMSALQIRRNAPKKAAAPPAGMPRSGARHTDEEYFALLEQLDAATKRLVTLQGDVEERDLVISRRDLELQQLQERYTAAMQEATKGEGLKLRLLQDRLDEANDLAEKLRRESVREKAELEAAQRDVREVHELRQRLESLEHELATVERSKASAEERVKDLERQLLAVDGAGAVAQLPEAAASPNAKTTPVEEPEKPRGPFQAAPVMLCLLLVLASVWVLAAPDRPPEPTHCVVQRLSRSRFVGHPAQYVSRNPAPSVKGTVVVHAAHNEEYVAVRAQRPQRFVQVDKSTIELADVPTDRVAEALRNVFAAVDAATEPVNVSWWWAP